MSKSTGIRYVTLAAGKAFDKYLEQTVKQANTLRNRFQILAVASLSHYLLSAKKEIGTGDYTLINRVMRAAIDVNYINARQLHKFFVVFAGLDTVAAWDEDKKREVTPDEFNAHNGFHKLPLDERLALIEEAKKTMWWTTIKVTSPFQPVSYDAVLNKALDDAEKKTKSAQERAEADGVKLDKYLDTEISGGTTSRVLSFLGVDRALQMAQQLVNNAKPAVADGAQ